MDTFLVIMLKDKVTGFLEKELASLCIDDEKGYIVNLFAMENDDERLELHLRFSTPRDVEDWEYDAVLDYYDTELYNGLVLSVSEVEDCFNPTWEIVIEYLDETEELESKVIELFDIHKNELEEVFKVIADKEGEYRDE